ncbi:hypothetical protein ACFL1S_07065 [Pseudomonadota bacterium]
MSSEPDLVCWKCGTSLAALSLPLRRLEVCAECDSELHVCRLCRFYDPNAIDQCVEEDTEEVRDKERANFCDYFKPGAGAYQMPDTSRTEASKSALSALFGDSLESDAAESSGSTKKNIEDLFD